MWSFEVNGTRYTFDSLGIRVITVGDTGMPNVDNISQENAYTDGSSFQRKRVPTRYMQIVGQLYGTNLTNLHSQRAIISNLLSPDNDIKLIYSGGSEEVYIDARYESGFNFNNTAHWFQDIFTLRFMCTYPFWRSTTIQTTDTTYDEVEIEYSNERHLTLYDAQNTEILDSSWGIDGIIRCIFEDSNHNIWLGGDFTGYCKYISPDGTVNNITGLNDTVWSINELPSDNMIFLGGDFTTPSNKICHVKPSVSNVATARGGDEIPADSLSVRSIFTWKKGSGNIVVLLWGVADTPGNNDMYMIENYILPIMNWDYYNTGKSPKFAVIDQKNITENSQYTFYLAGDTDYIKKIDFSYETPLFGGDGITVNSITNASIYGDITGVTEINDLIELEGKLYCIGDFTKADGIDATGIATFNGSFWEVPFKLNTTTTPVINAITKDKFDNLLIGGDFTLENSINSWSRNYLYGLLIYKSGFKSIAITTNHFPIEPNKLFNASNKTNKPGVLIEGESVPFTLGEFSIIYKNITIGGTKGCKPIIRGLSPVIANITTGKFLYLNTAYDLRSLSLDLNTGEVTDARGNLISQNVILPGSDISSFEFRPGDNTILVAFPFGTPLHHLYFEFQNEYWGFDT